MYGTRSATAFFVIDRNLRHFSLLFSLYRSSSPNRNFATRGEISFDPVINKDEYCEWLIYLNINDVYFARVNVVANFFFFPPPPIAKTQRRNAPEVTNYSG